MIMTTARRTKTKLDDQDEEEDDQDDRATLRVVLSELLDTFYIDLWSDLQFDEMVSDLLVKSGSLP